MERSIITRLPKSVAILPGATQFSSWEAVFSLGQWEVDLFLFYEEGVLEELQGLEQQTLGVDSIISWNS